MVCVAIGPTSGLSLAVSRQSEKPSLRDLPYLAELITIPGVASSDPSGTHGWRLSLETAPDDSVPLKHGLVESSHEIPIPALPADISAQVTLAELPPPWVCPVGLSFGEDSLHGPARHADTLSTVEASFVPVSRPDLHAPPLTNGLPGVSHPIIAPPTPYYEASVDERDRHFTAVERKAFSGASKVLPDYPKFAGSGDKRSVSALVQQTNLLSVQHAWYAIISEKVSKRVNPQGSRTHAAAEREVHRLVAALYDTYARPTDSIGSSLASFVELFQQRLLEYERTTGPLPVQYACDLLVTVLCAPDKEGALGIRRSLPNCSLEGMVNGLLKMKPYVVPERVSAETTDAAPPLSQGAGEGRATPPKAKSSSSQEVQRGNPRRKGTRSRYRCTRCLDSDPDCNGLPKLCAAPAPIRKADRCFLCNRLKLRCPDTSTCPWRDSVSCERCQGRHHTSHCTKPLKFEKSSTPTSDTCTLSMESITISNVRSSSVCLEETSTSDVAAAQVQRDPCHPLRHLGLSFKTSSGSTASFNGLLDSGAMMHACSSEGLAALQRAAVVLVDTGRTCNARLAAGSLVTGYPILALTHVHQGVDIPTEIVLISNLNRLFLWSTSISRSYPSPTIWVFDHQRDRLISLVGKTPAVLEARSYFVNTLDNPPATESTHFPDSHRHRDPADEAPGSLSTDLLTLASELVDDIPDYTREFLEVAFAHTKPFALSLCSGEKSLTSEASTHVHRLGHRIRWVAARPSNDYRPFLAKARTLASRLRKQGLYEVYDNEIQNFLRSGYIRPATVGEVTYWMSHFPVIKSSPEGGPTTSSRSSMKVRPVFNGAPLAHIVHSSLPTGCDQGVVQSLSLIRRFPFFSSLDLRQAFLQLELVDVRDQRCMAWDVNDWYT
ncbi:hypothetical protein FOL47_009084 [Perkinsus chesapeaki]|uniref:Uncharacterized protein n=1 Tax=Perkinsus chesapeaki TaxID=330153 RepID=A0A7J6LAK4_PERCH|nr:hypothetical protein FOL47_009084 [Perkinsus chesapeaki]